MNKPLASTNQRLMYVGLGFVTALVILIIRLVYLQLMLGMHFHTKSQKNFLRIEKMIPERGTIYDIHGKPLATNRPYTQLIWQGTGNKKLSSAQLSALSIVEKIIGRNIVGDRELLASLLKKERYKQNVILADRLSFEQLSQIAEQCSDNTNLLIKHQYERFYPYKTAAAHAIGHLKNSLYVTQACGASGLEKIGNLDLSGTDGRFISTIDAAGHAVHFLELEPTAPGSDITTTLDIDLQLIAEEAFSPELTGTFLVMDPANGAILVMLSRPHFDPFLFTKSIDCTTWHHIQEGLPFINRALNTTYPPGSIFKLITASAALEQGIITPELKLRVMVPLPLVIKPIHAIVAGDMDHLLALNRLLNHVINFFLKLVNQLI